MRNKLEVRSQPLLYNERSSEVFSVALEGYKMDANELCFPTLLSLAKRAAPLQGKDSFLFFHFLD